MSKASVEIALESLQSLKQAQDTYYEHFYTTLKVFQQHKADIHEEEYKILTDALCTHEEIIEFINNMEE